MWIFEAGVSAGEPAARLQKRTHDDTARFLLFMWWMWFCFRGLFLLGTFARRMGGMLFFFFWFLLFCFSVFVFVWGRRLARARMRAHISLRIFIYIFIYIYTRARSG